MEKATPPATFDAIIALSQYGAPEDELAEYFGLTLDELRAIPRYDQARARGEAERKMLLRKARMTRALAGNGDALKQASQGEVGELVNDEKNRLLAEYIALRAR